MADRERRLKRAAEFIFSTGMNDVTAQLARLNMQYGLAKMQYVQELYGMRQDASFIGVPDQSITRNTGRWLRNVSYGGKISWGSGKDRLVMLDVKPNACGVTVAGMDELPSLKVMVDRIHHLESSAQVIKGIPIEWDAYKSNHFINVYKCNSDKFPPYLVILHAGAPELKGKNARGPGLYHDEDGDLRTMMTTHDTPFGPCSVLHGRNVRSFMKFHEFALGFSHKRRARAVQTIFPRSKVVFEAHHQYLANQNEVHLGAYGAVPGKWYPLTLREDAPAFLVTARPVFTSEQIRRLGWGARAARLGMTDRLRRANILPHGGGYVFPESHRVRSVIETNSSVVFELSMRRSSNTVLVHDPRELPYTYRGLEVVKRTVDLGMCKVRAELEPVYVFKI